MTTVFQAIGAALFLIAVFVLIVAVSGFVVGFVWWLLGEGYSWGWW